MRILDLSQEGPDWHEWRAAGIGSSEASVIMDENPFTCRDELLARKLGQMAALAENDAMRKGKRLEPIARGLYQTITGIRCRPCCIVHDVWPWLRASLDGLSEDNTIVLEIKCPSKPGGHEKALAGQVPSYYTAQVQHQLAASGWPNPLKRLHFVSYFEDDPYNPIFKPEERFAMVPVEPDLDYQKRLIMREKRFWDLLQKEGKHGQK